METMGRASGAGVRFSNVSKRYGDTQALTDFDLTIAPGEFVTLLGPSGSGKTTALNILAGFADLSGGDVSIGDRSVAGLPPEARNVGMVFQNFSLFPHMNVFDNVAFPLRLRRVPRRDIGDRVVAALAMVRLDAFARRRPHELSGGQRQRVAFARAIVFAPPVLLMDEPLSALDLKLREAMRLEIRQYHSTIGCTIVFVTHDQGEALTLSDRVAVMRDGRIEQTGTPEAIYDRPANRFVAEFIGQTNMLALEIDGNSVATLPQLGVADARLPGRPGHVISLRPDKLRRVADGDVDADLVSFDAVVDEPLFLGEVVQYSVRLPSGMTLLFKESRGAGRDVLRRNEPVRLAFRPEDAIPVSVDPGQTP